MGAREVTRKHKCEMEAANMQLVLSFSCIPASSADRLDLQQIPSSGRRTAVRFKRLQARRRNGRLVLILSLALWATLVPRPRMQWTLLRLGRQ